MKNNLCKCGCGNFCEKNYLKGHGRKGKKCSDEHKRKIGEANRGRICTEEEKNRLRTQNINRKHSKETKDKMSRVAKEKGFCLWMKGRKLPKEVIEKGRIKRIGHITSDETKRKISEANSGKKNGFYGKTHSDEYKEILRNNCGDFRKNAHTPEAIEKRRRKQKGKTVSSETRKKMRIAKLNHIEMKNGGICPMHNINACKYLDNLSEKMGWNLTHALNGGEYHIKELGYFVDGYDKKNNIVVEYDEFLHYSKTTGKLKQKDIMRQTEIINNLKCKFFRFNESKGKLYEII